jgi:hypothetical protein
MIVAVISQDIIPIFGTGSFDPNRYGEKRLTLNIANPESKITKHIRNKIHLRKVGFLRGKGLVFLPR